MSLITRIFPFFCMLTICCFGDVRTLTVDECVCIALNSNPDLQVAEMRVLRAIGHKNVARSQFLPQIDMDGVIDNNNRTLAGELTQFQDFKSTRALGISAQMGIFDFGATWKKFKAAKLRIDVTEWEKKKVLADVEEIVRNAYFRVLEKGRLLDVLQAQKERLDLQIAKTQGFYEVGRVRYSDVLSVRVDLLEAEKNILAVEHELEMAWLSLNRLLQFPPCERFILVDVESEEPYCPDFTCVSEFADKTRPDLMAYRLELEALCLERLSLKRSRLPAFYAFTNANVSFGDHTSVSAGLGMKLPIYHGGIISAEMQILVSRIGEVSILLEETRKNIAFEIQSLCLRFEEIQKNHNLALESFVFAEQNFRDYEELYENGMASIHEVLDAQGMLKQAKLELILSMYQKQYALAHFKNISGGFCT